MGTDAPGNLVRTSHSVHSSCNACGSHRLLLWYYAATSHLSLYSYNMQRALHIYSFNEYFLAPSYARPGGRHKEAEIPAVFEAHILEWR